MLLVDDDPAIHLLVGKILKRVNIELASTTDGEEGLRLACKTRPDLILLDHNMAGLAGIDLLKAIKKNPSLSGIPAVFVTGNQSSEVLAECFDNGAVDYVQKPILAPELVARVQNALDHRRLLKYLEQLALHDTLTGLPNRPAIIDRIQQTIDNQNSQPAESTTHAAVLFLDFDRFKIVNDSLGHEAGDVLLKQIAQRLIQAFRVGDWAARVDQFDQQTADGPSNHLHTAARLGGDEFVVLLNGLKDPKGASAAAHRLVGCFSKPYPIAGHEVYSTASIGVVSSTAGYTHAEDILRDADTAMYAAKAAGKSRYIVFDQALRETANTRLTTVTDLRHALQENELTAYYQPIVDLKKQRPVGCEALARWCHPTRGLLKPEAFISIAEETGMIVALGKQIMAQACQMWRKWQDELDPSAPKHIHVNISRAELADPSFVERVQALIDKHQMPPAALQIEVNEAKIMNDPLSTAQTLESLRGAGVLINMDDFGTGHSSLNCLQNMPLDVIKIDQALTTNIHLSKAFAALP